ncbi:MAG: TraR/DksA family transcriptional regulator [Tepidisphaeraceae bacterium]
MAPRVPLIKAPPGAILARRRPGATVIATPVPRTKPAKLKPKIPEPQFIPPPPVPVPTDGKPRKNQAGFTSRELEHYRELLLAKRRELVGDMSSMEREALRSAQGSNLSNVPLHMADMGTDNYEQEFTLGLVEKDRQLLREINVALAKIQDGRFGICEGTGKPINKPRLEAQPWAKYSIEYARMMERGLVRRL